MKIFALSDLHLSLSCPEKDMAFFGAPWQGYIDKIAHNWSRVVGPDDWVLVAGDICWAMRPNQAALDLAWIDHLPGRKVLIRGNHDYWWPSKSKLHALLPKTLYSAQGELVELAPGLAVVGTRLWDSPEYSFDSVINWQGSRNDCEPASVEACDLFQRELLRLEMALGLFQPHHHKRWVMLHYPPIGLELQPSRTSQLLEHYRVDLCLFGHLHSLKSQSAPLFGEARGVRYLLTSADWLDFFPQLLLELPEIAPS